MKSSVFQRQARPAAGTVIDAKDLPHVTVGRAAGILLRQLGDGLGVGPCQLLHQTLPVVLALIDGDKPGHTPNHPGKVGIHIAPPRLVDDVQHLNVALSGVCSAELNAFCALKGSPADRTQGRQCGFVHLSGISAVHLHTSFR